MARIEPRSAPTERAAADAWLGLDGGYRVPRATERIKPRKISKSRGKTFAFRLEGAGPNGESVIAKLTSSSTASLEQHVYDELLSQLGAPAPTCYGVAEDVSRGIVMSASSDPSCRRRMSGSWPQRPQWSWAVGPCTC
jgi:hypothetical protein